MRESTLECFGRVSLADTTGIINKRGKAIYDKAIEIGNKRIDDKTETNIPNYFKIKKFFRNRKKRGLLLL